MTMISAPFVAGFLCAVPACGSFFPQGGYLKRWRKPLVSALMQRCKQSPTRCHDMDIYEFGVFTGRMLKAMARALDDKDLAGTIWGFDSFRGLPRDEESATKGEFRGLRGVWGQHGEIFREGRFDVRKEVAIRRNASAPRSGLEDDGVAEAMAAVSAYINSSRVRLVPGFFNQSLVHSLASSSGMKPALYVDIDSDQYVGSFQALDWLCRNGLLVNGTIIGYDDFNQGYPAGWHGWPPTKSGTDYEAPLQGEPRAHRKIEKVWGVKFVKLQYVPSSGGESGWAFEITHPPRRQRDKQTKEPGTHALT